MDFFTLDHYAYITTNRVLYDSLHLFGLVSRLYSTIITIISSETTYTIQQNLSSYDYKVNNPITEGPVYSVCPLAVKFSQ